MPCLRDDAMTPSSATTASSARRLALGRSAWVLRGQALGDATALATAVAAVIAESPLRHLETPGGRTMSVAMTNCGDYGWVSDRRGYRYSALDPLTGRPWPAMPAVFLAVARAAAAQVGFADFCPDACLINRYEPGARLTLHQDRDELQLQAPIVSVSLGRPARFQFGGLRRSDPIERYPLFDGDIVIWGGEDRLRYHGILPLKLADAAEPDLFDSASGAQPTGDVAAADERRFGRARVNLTFRRSGYPATGGRREG